MNYRETMTQLDERAKTVREFAGSSPSRAMLELLDAIEASYFEDFRQVTPEKLARLQGQLAQIQSLREVLSAKNTNGRV